MDLHPQWIVGFVDGEGCFHVQINRSNTVKLGFQVLPEFVVSQHVRSIQVLYALKKHFGTGTVRKESPKKGKNGIVRQDGRIYRVRNINFLRNTILPFFEKNPLKTAKHVDFLKFRDILLLMEKEEHLTVEGLERIRKIKAEMNRGQTNTRGLSLHSYGAGGPLLRASLQETTNEDQQFNKD